MVSIQSSKTRWFRVTHNRNLPLWLLGIALAANACAVMQPTDAGGPRATGPPYPVVLPTQGDRTQASMLELNRVVGQTESVRPRVELDPVTATIRRLPLDPAVPLYLPKVGTGTEMNEEETRESLRRFIEDWKILIGAEPSQLSLIEQTAQPDGTQIASYEQRAFRYPLRGDYGKLQIQFSPSRRLLNLSSSCIPAAERVQTMLAGISPRVKVEEVTGHVRSKPVTYIDSSGRPQTYQLSSNNEMQVSALVTYALLSKATPDSLEFHVAWEVNVTNAPFKTLYLDAVKDEIIAAR
jgi:hypothetical protein